MKKLARVFMHTAPMGGQTLQVLGRQLVVMLRIRPKFLWMLPMGVRDNHTKYEPETQWWCPGTGVASAGPPFQNLQFRAKISLSLPKTALERAENGQMKGNSGYSTHTTRFPCAEKPSRAL